MSKALFNRLAQILIIVVLGLFLLKNASQPDFLNEWDERFHAIVAKNLTEDFSVPRLYRDAAVESYPYNLWFTSEVWLHKPPLFSYQSALVMKVFGTNLLGYRLTGFFTLSLLGFTFYKILRLYKLKVWHALSLSLGAIFSLAFLKLANGVLGMGQNDLSFILWISFGVFYAEKARIGEGKMRLRNIMLLAIFSSLAVLNKFLVGYLPFLILGLNAFLHSWKAKEWLALFAWALLPAATIASWYAYTYQIAPELTVSEFEYSSLHFSQALEGHSHGPFFHLAWFSKSFIFTLVVLISLWAMSVSLKRTNLKSNKNFPKAFYAALGSVLFVLLFFTVAQTKLPAFTLVSAPLLMVAIGLLYQQEGLISSQAKKYIFLLPVLGIVAGMQYIIVEGHRDPRRECQHHFYANLGDSLPANAVLFNLDGFTHAQAMFYSGLICYNNIPRPIWVEEAKSQGYIPYLLLRGEESEDLRALFQDHLLEYPCPLE
jgi:4-amino-4-deoxy-L-arabinose transferase